ncbi:MAG: ATPase [Clostridium sp.]|nr:ATPase [Clostridium sp.]
MDTVINKLSEIEDAAGSIMDEAAVRKKAFAEEMEKRTEDFDAALEKETADEIARIQREMEADMNALLAKQTADCEALLKELDENYNQHHERYVKALFHQMIKE